MSRRIAYGKVFNESIRYVLSFALMGSRLQIGLLPSMGLIGIAYVLLRSFGKITGAWLGGTVGGTARKVRNNLGLGLLSQAGVAVGLAIASANRFEPYGQEGQRLGALIICVITAFSPHFCAVPYCSVLLDIRQVS